MGFFDKIKKVFGSEDDVEYQNTDETNNKDELAEDKEEKEIQPINSEESVLNNKVSDEQKVIRNFKYLDDLIHSRMKEIVLDSDIVLGSDEESQYLEGIKLDVDDFAIDGNGHTIDAQGLTRIFYCTGKNVIIKNIILKNGHVEDGGAIYNDDGELTIISSTINNNIAGRDGGAIHNSDGELTIISSTLTENTAYGSGGAIHNKDGEITITETTLTENTARWNGGAIHNKDGEITIIETTLTENTANSDGGAIHNNCSLTITSSTLTENTAKFGGAIHNKDGEITIIETTLTENTARWNGGAIHNNGSLTITESIFNNNTAQREGGAIFNQDECVMTITGSTLTENTAEYGGAIHNNGSLTITSSTLTENTARWDGGAIHNEKGELTITSSTLTENTANIYGGAIYNHGGTPIIINCEILFNKSEESIISNSDSSFNNANLEFQYTKFNDNQSEYIISNKDDAKLVIIEGEFRRNNVEESVIYNDGKSSTIDKTIFENKLSTAHNIINQSNLTLISPKIKDDGKTILNSGQILIKRSSKDFENKIYGDGIVETSSIPVGQKSDFSYLDKKIHKSPSKEIILEEDIYLENYELDFYEGGIELDIDGLVIDGNGHAIDGRGKTRIFIITGNNITLKNITFKNGHSYKNYNSPINNNGGAIKNNLNQNISINNCKFISNTSEGRSGAIHNIGGLSIVESNFHENTAISGGSISNEHGSLTINKSTFKDNIARTSGAICNNGSLTIMESEFNENIAQDLGGSGAIQNRADGELNIIHSIFNQNAAKDGNSGAINNMGTLIIKKSKFTRNTAECKLIKHGIGGAIRNSNSLIIVKSELSDNESNYGGAIYNNDGELILKESSLNNNIAINGGAVFNHSELNIAESTFNSNMANSGGAIVNKGELNITESTFNSNMAKEGHGAISSNNYELTIKNCKFNNNKPNDY